MERTCATKRRGAHREKEDEDGIAEQTERRTSKRTSIDVVKEDMAVGGVTEEDTRDRKKWNE